MPRPKYKLFVYGTLKKGFPNHSYLREARYLGKAVTKDPYPLIAPKIFYPYLIDAKGEGYRVWGELYEIDYPTLKRIDRLEEYPRYYTRRTLEVIDHEGRTHEALSYFLAQQIPYRHFRYLKSFEPKEQGA
ncbi:MAG: gamma-glutamylcyclotransferase [Epsilonproteobacteria bacterium]|nr:gamma-glutamylcyclotransferase [Campylobacterota bacterium]NPA64118.1 gamma-glutamylcyclotransferase [Campylobacterota bacterium]